MRRLTRIMRGWRNIQANPDDAGRVDGCDEFKMWRIYDKEVSER